MKFFKLLFLGLLMLTILLFNACTKDEKQCVEEDFYGLWAGDAVCDSSTINYLGFRVSLKDDVLRTKYISDTLATELDNCNFHASITGNYEYDINGTLNDNTLTVVIHAKTPFKQDRCEANLKLK